MTRGLAALLAVLLLSPGCATRTTTGRVVEESDPLVGEWRLSKEAFGRSNWVHYDIRLVDYRDLKALARAQRRGAPVGRAGGSVIVNRAPAECSIVFRADRTFSVASPPGNLLVFPYEGSYTHEGT